MGYVRCFKILLIWVIYYNNGARVAEFCSSMETSSMCLNGAIFFVIRVAGVGTSTYSISPS